MNKDQAAALRKEFPPAAIGKLPKAGVTVDYVGHAATTDRLLQVDPEWTWEPLAVDEAGLPAMDAAGNLWIRLTVAGVTRIGVGDGKNMKERIGDAIRNAAMRFGVALDLWAKEDLHAMEQERGEPAPEPAEAEKPATRRMGLAVTPAQLKLIHTLLGKLGIPDRETGLRILGDYAGLSGLDALLESSKHLTMAQATRVIDRLNADVEAMGSDPLDEEPA